MTLHYSSAVGLAGARSALQQGRRRKMGTIDRARCMQGHGENKNSTCTCTATAPATTTALFSPAPAPRPGRVPAAGAAGRLRRPPPTSRARQRRARTRYVTQGPSKHRRIPRKRGRERPCFWKKMGCAPRARTLPCAPCPDAVPLGSDGWRSELLGFLTGIDFRMTSARGRTHLVWKAAPEP